LDTLGENVDHLVSDRDVLANGLEAVAHDSLLLAARVGLSDDHSFSITFYSRYPGVVLSDAFLEKYPKQISIILHRQFEDLAVFEDCFQVTISFEARAERICVPYGAMISFSDARSKSTIALRLKATSAATIISEPSPSASDLVRATEFRLAGIGSEFDQVFVQALREIAAKYIAMFDAMGGPPPTEKLVVRFSAQHPGVEADENFKEFHEDLVNANFRISQIQFMGATDKNFSFLYYTDRLKVTYDAITLLEVSSGSASLGVEVADRELRRARHEFDLFHSRGKLGQIRDAVLGAISNKSDNGREDEVVDIVAMSVDEPDTPSPTSSQQSGFFGVFEPHICSIVGGCYLFIGAIIYVASYGLHYRFMTCAALMRIDPLCGQSSDVSILRGLTHPFSAHIFPIVLLYSVLLLVRAIQEMANGRDIDVKNLFKAAIVLRGFFSGFSTAKFVVGFLYGTGIALQGYIFNTMSFVYIYLLYAMSFFLRYLMPMAKERETPYGFICDALFAMGASALFALGFDKSVDTVTSGAIFVICAFLAMLIADRLMTKFQRRSGAVLALMSEKLDGDQQVNMRELFKAYFVAKRETSAMSGKDMEQVLQSTIAGAELSADSEIEAKVDSSSRAVMTGLLIVWFVPFYFAFWLIAKLVLSILT
jgi:hypothetical protein